MSEQTLESITRLGQPQKLQPLDVGKGFVFGTLTYQAGKLTDINWPQFLQEAGATFQESYAYFYNRLASSNFDYLQRKLNASSNKIRNAVGMDVRVMHGNPVFSGTRIPIYQIIEEVADGNALPEILESYPTLSREQVQIGLDFAASLLRIYDE